MIEIVAPGPLATIQDLGRTGLAHLGVGRSGAADRSALRRANRLVGNPDRAAAIEVTAGGLVLRSHGDHLVACTGAPCDGVVANGSVWLRAGETLSMGRPLAGLRSYVAVRGGLDVAPILGSRSTDLLTGIGPPPLGRGDVVPIGTETAGWPTAVLAPVPAPASQLVIELTAGPRTAIFAAAWPETARHDYQVSSQSNRTAVRLEGPPLSRTAYGEIASEGMLTGAVQVPNDGRPIIFLADHPVTGGYPVVGYVGDDDLDRLAQLRPGDTVRFAPRIRSVDL